MPATTKTTTIASYAVDLVVALGADTVFSLTGGMAMHLNRAAARHAGLRSVYCQHEQACVAAAEGYAQAADFRRPGFAIVTAGPGVSNTVTSLVSAYGDSVPLIVLAGQIKAADIDSFGTRTHGIQEIRSREIISPCVKSFARLEAAGFREVLADTLAAALGGRPGPVFVEIPLDVQGVPVAYAEAEIAAAAAEIKRRVLAAVGDQAGLVAGLRALLGARRPLVYVGNGCRAAGVEAAVRGFIATHRIPAVFSWQSFDILAGGDALHFGCPGGLAPIYANEILCRADVILFLGGRLDLGTTGFQREAFGPRAARYFVDVDEAELSKFAGFENTRCIQADLRLLPAAMAEVDGSSAADAGWLGWCGERRLVALAEERRRLGSGRMTVYEIAGVISPWSDGLTIVPASSGYAVETFLRFFVPGAGTRIFNGAALGAMGMGLPQAIGAAFGTAHRVVGFEADGGLMLNLQELATVVTYAPAGFVLFILNNRGYESIRVSQTRFFNQVSGADEGSGVFIPDFRGIAGAFGLDYVLVEELEALRGLLPALTRERAPIIVDLIIEQGEPRGPAVRTVMDAEGRPTSTPLAEISW
jgi:acetolactate synthase-1/2/3 large subunit